MKFSDLNIKTILFVCVLAVNVFSQTDTLNNKKYYVRAEAGMNFFEYGKLPMAILPHDLGDSDGDWGGFRIDFGYNMNHALAYSRFYVAGTRSIIYSYPEDTTNGSSFNIASLQIAPKLINSKILKN